jgi:hypothetical protein
MGRGDIQSPISSATTSSRRYQLGFDLLRDDLEPFLGSGRTLTEMQDVNFEFLYAILICA